MGKEWGITSDDYSWIVTIQYIGYILFHWVCKFKPNSKGQFKDNSTDPSLVDPCLDIRPLASLGRHDGPWMGFNEHAPGSDYEFRRNHGTAFPRWSVRGWIRPCCGPLHDIFLSPWRDGSSIWSVHLLLAAHQLLCFSTRIRTCSCQDIHPQLETALPCR